MNFTASEDYCGDARVIQHSFIKHHINKLGLRREDTVLDVGCGTGEETAWIAKGVKFITAIDNSEEMLAVAAESNSVCNVAYFKCDAQTVGDNPDWREKFDKVVCFYVLHWVPDELEAIRSISKCLKSAGEALFIIDGQDDNFVLLQATSFLKGHKKWGPYVKDYQSQLRQWTRSASDTEEVFKACGWERANCEVRQHEVYLSETQFKLFMKTCLGETPLIPAADQEDYLQDLWQWGMECSKDKSRAESYRFTTFLWSSTLLNKLSQVRFSKQGKVI
ncbi:juvenile hormone acid O-methyltransferase-like [Acanthaster planci]|uniref:Juvenile hormone acid O-methyltransferase-like n=1 Tax=Acanthaster planci TaxID=133434 RepID=A0A8B7ZM98_ACAPL|nr:juvenile hormone acid O-methyltransferase-like [Acanthaster planci]